MLAAGAQSWASPGTGSNRRSGRAGKLVGGRGLEMIWDSGVIETSRVVRARLPWWSR